MRLSQYLLPVLKENPREAQIVSHRLMLRAGMIRQLTSGIYSWLPLGIKVLRKVENIVREEMEKANAVELLMPTMQPSELWEESGRGDYGKETLKATDRHDNTLIYGPTNEEVITDIFRKSVKSYKDLPKNLFHIQWKFRDEIRPRFGVMRGREFFMKDAYSFDIDEESAIQSYENMFSAYFKIFKKLGLKAIPFKAETGQIGGELSHEFQVIAETGESEIFFDEKYEELFEKESLCLKDIENLYARTDEMHNPESDLAKNNKIVSSRGIEVGHIFYLGDKYSKPMKAEVQTSEGKSETVKMGCYGIGVSRLVGAIIEACSDDKGIIWPKSVAPFDAVLINLKPKDAETTSTCDEIYSNLKNSGFDILYDDKDESAGQKFATADLIGLPYQIVIGPRGAKEGKAEIVDRKTSEKQNIEFDKIKDFLKD